MPLLVWTKDLVLFIFAKGIRKIFYTYDFYSYDKYWINIMTDNAGVVKGKLNWEVKSSILTGLKIIKPIDRKNFVMR